MKEYLVHLCANTPDAACSDVWIRAADDEDPEALALERYPNTEAVSLLFDDNNVPVSRPCREHTRARISRKPSQLKGSK